MSAATAFFSVTLPVSKMDAMGGRADRKQPPPGNRPGALTARRQIARAGQRLALIHPRAWPIRITHDRNRQQPTARIKGA